MQDDVVTIDTVDVGTSRVYEVVPVLAPPEETQRHHERFGRKCISGHSREVLLCPSLSLGRG